MARLLYPANYYQAALLELAAHAVIVLRLHEFAQRTGLPVEEACHAHCREIALVIPPEETNDVLRELDLAGLLMPTQQIAGPLALHGRLQTPLSTLTWDDDDDYEPCGKAPRISIRSNSPVIRCLG